MHVVLRSVGTAAADSLRLISLRIEVKTWCCEQWTSSLVNSDDQFEKLHREGQIPDHVEDAAIKCFVETL